MRVASQTAIRTGITLVILFFGASVALGQISVPPTGTVSGGGTAGTTTGGGTGGGTGGFTGTTPGGQQVIIFSENFDGASPQFTLDDPTNPPNVVGWGFDGTPTVSSGPVAVAPFVSAPNSINYNNGNNYDDGTANSGTATSVPIDISGAVNGEIRFMCMYSTETLGVGSDERRVQILDNNGVVYQALCAEIGASGIDACSGGFASWHQHTIPIDNTWPGMIQIRFVFDTMDNQNNNFEGWFIDNVTVSADSVTGGTTGTGTTTAGTTTGGGGGSVSREGDNGDGNPFESLCSSARSDDSGSAAALAALLLIFGLLAVRKMA